jgi:hypothetical protein
MYLYFDKNGVLLETINDEALRQYNHQVNTIYVYIEDSPEYLRYWFERPNGDETEVYSTVNHPGDEIVTETIPVSAKRDLQKFQYGIKYKMFKILMPCGRLIGDDEYEYNIFEDAGPVSLSIKAIYDEGEKELTLGKVVFTIEQEVVVPSERISISQFEYLLNTVERIGATEANHVPLRLSIFEEITETPTIQLRQKANLYVDVDNESKRISLEQIKDMNTKILSVDNVEEADFNKLSVGDFIYEKIKENI